MLSEAEKLTFQLHKYGFIYLTPFPIVWDENYTSLHFNWSKRTKRLFQVNMLLITLALIGCLYNLLHHFLIQPITNYHIGIIGLHFSCVIILSLPGLALVLWYRHQEAVPGINMFLSSTLHQTRGKSHHDYTFLM